ncbi:hypothetical protein HDU97_005697 [Phlyctochytrium planicorne]|nr:hypothetical protein HDU97_005697 [Phlyctochytrium planicorne]
MPDATQTMSNPSPLRSRRHHNGVELTPDGKIASTFQSSYMPHDVKASRDVEKIEYAKNKGKAGKGGEWWGHDESKFETNSCYRDSFKEHNYRLLRMNNADGPVAGKGNIAKAFDENQFRTKWFQYRMRKPPTDDPGKHYDILTANSCGVGCKFLCDFGAYCDEDADCYSQACYKRKCNYVAPSVVLPSSTRILKTDRMAASQDPAWVGKFDSNTIFPNWKASWSYGKNNVKIVKDPESGDENVLQATYPQGSFRPSSNPIGGFGISASPIDLSDEQTVTLEYQVYFPQSFNFNMGGKLPGLFGGEFGCSGGDSAKNCFSARFMWREDGNGEVYMYVNQAAQNKQLCRPPLLIPNTVCNPDYGISVDRGGFKFVKGSWNQIHQTIKLNSFSSAGRPVEDGVLTIYHNNNLIFSLKSVVFRLKPNINFIGIDVETFFGGNTRDYASPKTQSSFFKGFRLYLN